MIAIKNIKIFNQSPLKDFLKNEVLVFSALAIWEIFCFSLFSLKRTQEKIFTGKSWAVFDGCSSDWLGLCITAAFSAPEIRIKCNFIPFTSTLGDSPEVITRDYHGSYWEIIEDHGFLVDICDQNLYPWMSHVKQLSYGLSRMITSINHWFQPMTTVKKIVHFGKYCWKITCSSSMNDP